jgi:hypothetical protein
VTTIDLGEVTSAPVEPADPAAPVPRRQIRSVALTVLALLALITLTASAPPRPQGVRPLWTAPLTTSDTMYLTADSVYVNRLDQAQDRAVLTAYDVATGAQRWTADAGALTIYPDAVTSTVVVQPTAMAEHQTDAVTVAFIQTTVGLDTATGARLWEMHASPVHAAGDAVLMSEQDTTGRVIRLRMIRQRDGAAIWTRAVAANSGVAANDHAVVTVDDRGELSVLNWADGSVRQTRTVPWTPDSPQNNVSNELDLIGGDLIVNRSAPGADQALVYRLDTLAEVWHDDGYLSDCAPVLCSIESDDVAGRDPDTGAERWRLTGLTQAYPIGAGRLLADLPSDEGHQLLIDAATGQTVSGPIKGRTTWFGETGGPPLLIGTTRHEPVRSTITRIDRRTGEQFLLGSIPWIGADGAGCETGWHYLACPGEDGLIVTAVD